VTNLPKVMGAVDHAVQQSGAYRFVAVEETAAAESCGRNFSPVALIPPRAAWSRTLAKVLRSASQPPAGISAKPSGACLGNLENHLSRRC